MQQKPPTGSTPGQGKPPKSGWNDRFHLESIPEYSALQDKNINQQKLNSRMKSRQGGSRARLEVGGRIRPQTRSKAGDNLSVRSGSTDGSPMKSQAAVHGQYQHNYYAHQHVGSSGGNPSSAQGNRGQYGPSSQSVQGYPVNKKPRAQSNMRKKRQTQVNEETLQLLKEELYQLWDTYQIDDYHRNIFDEVTQGLSPEILSPIIAMEIQDFQLDKAPILKLTKGIIAREECLKQALNFQDQLGTIINPGSNLINQAIELIHSLRMLSIHCVEMIQIWRDQIMYSYRLSNTENPGMMPQIPYIWKNTNYLIKIKDDTAWMRKSQYNKFFNFAKNDDPFFVVTASQHVAQGGGGIKGLKSKAQSKSHNNSQQDKKQIVPLQNPVMKRVRICENLILEEAVQQELNKQNNDKEVLGDTTNDSNLEPLIEEKSQLQTTEGDDLPPPKQEKAETEVDDDEGEQIVLADIKPEDLILRPLNHYIQSGGGSFQFQFEQYYEHVDDQMKKTVSQLQQIKERIDKGYFPHYYTLGHESTPAILGMLVFNYDHQYQIRKRVNILHLSTLNSDHLEQMIKLAIQYIFSSFDAEEVRVELLQPKSEENVDQNVKGAYKKNAFRWKQYINMESGDKKEVMGANRPEGVSPGENALQCKFNPLTARAGVLLRVGTQDSQSRPTTGVEDGKVLNKTCLLSALMEYKGKYIDPEMSISEHKNMSIDANNLNELLKHIETNQCQLPQNIHRTTISNSCPEATKLLNEQGIPIEGLRFGETETQDTFISTVMSIECQWTSFSLHQLSFGDKLTDFVGLGHEKFNVAISGDYKVIHWPTDDSSMNMFVVIGDVEPIRPSQMFSFSQNLLSNAQESQELVDCLYIPGFNKRVNQRPLNYLTGYILDDNKCVTKAYESLQFNIWSSPQYEAYIEPEIKTNSIILDKPFLIGITHEKLSGELEFPLVISKVSNI